MLPSLAGVTLASVTKGSTLQVQVTYSGAGVVDDKHKLYVSLWDTPDFAKAGNETAPFALKFVTSKSAVAEFTDLDKSPVYVGTIYDPTGKWDAQSAPPSGTSVGLYSTEPGVPAPVTLEDGKTTKISTTLDDSIKLP
jgi:hypothetical protein